MNDQARPRSLLTERVQLWAVTALAAAMIAGVAFIAWHLLVPREESAAEIKAGHHGSIVVDPAKLMHEYFADPVAARKRYEGPAIDVRGKIVRLQSDAAYMDAGPTAHPLRVELDNQSRSTGMKVDRNAWFVCLNANLKKAAPVLNGCHLIEWGSSEDD